MVVVIWAPPTKLIRVKAEIRFQAEDPWNGNRRGVFTVDTYCSTLRSIKAVSADLKEPLWAGGFHRALRAESDGMTRFLPESLMELWRTKQIPTESLPGLLRQMEPGIRTSDYRPMLRDRRMKVAVFLEIVLGVALVIIEGVAAVMGQAPLWIAVAVVLGTAFVWWAFLYLLYFGKLFRRQRQMRWLLERVNAGGLTLSNRP
jgi:hypothetical protein